MILVTGATGHLGSAVVAHLLKKTEAKNIVALARNEEKAAGLKAQGVAVRIGDLDDAASLDRAMEGIEKVLLISTVDPHRYEQHKRVVDAAKKAEVKHIAYTSVAMNDVEGSAIKALMGSHFQTEDYIKQSGLKYTLLRNSLYADILPMFVGEQVFDNGVYIPAGDGKVPYALRREMGEAAANVLLGSEHENKVYNIAGGESYSYADIAATLSKLSGKEVSYTDADAATYPQQLKEAGAPDEVVFLVSGFAADTKAHRFEVVGSDLAALLGRQPASLYDSLKELYNF